MKILIVDDAKTMRTIIKNVLKKLGFSDENFLEAGDGEEALKILEENADDIKIIFLDWNMPKMNGFEFLKKVRSNPKYNHIKIVMVTTETKKENVIAALKAGANNYIAKPFTPQVLKQKLEQMKIKM
jgi:two-component system chemotaxis response regulator CheY